MEMKRWTKSKKAAVFLPTLILIGAGAFLGFKKYKAKGVSEAPSDVATVARGSVELHFTDSGELAPKISIDVASKVSGRVTELDIAEGDRIRKGDKLAIIQPGRSEAERYMPFTLNAPVGGIVMQYQPQGQYQQDSKMAKLGDYVTGLLDSTNPTYLLTIGDLSKLIVKMKISEMDILKLHEGMAVNVTVDALPGETFPSKVTLVSPQAEKDQNNLKNFRVEVTLLKADPRLKPGMTARVDGLLETRKNVLKIPLSAVFEEGDKAFAYVKAKEGKPDKVEVKLGLRNEMEVEVVGGVSEGQALLTERPADKPAS